jgi:hypothetical protein
MSRMLKGIALLFAVGALVGIAVPEMAEATPPAEQNTATETHSVPSIEAARAMIMGEWENMVGPNPFTTEITQDTLWNSKCWSHYR